jgi:tRNA-guanine family transglycosylase
MMLVPTAHGPVEMPAYLPVTTGDPNHLTDRLVRPFLRRHAAMVMMSFGYSVGCRARPLEMPLFVDSGGFRLLEQGARIQELADGTAAIVFDGEQEGGGSDSGAAEVDRLDPATVLAHQELVADFAATLDFPIPVSLGDPVERERRLRLTVANARWALAQVRNPQLTLFGSVQGWDAESYRRCAAQLVEAGFRHLAVGGLVPRIAASGLVVALVRAVAEVLPEGGLLHAFGVGEPGLVRQVVEAGATSVDSSSYARQAVSGRRWDGKAVPADASPLERSRAALANLGFAVSSLRT